jgi:hypothetical protein
MVLHGEDKLLAIGVVPQKPCPGRLVCHQRFAVVAPGNLRSQPLGFFKTKKYLQISLSVL